MKEKGMVSGGFRRTDPPTIQQHKWGPRKMLNKTLQAPTAKRKCQNKTWHHHLGKLQGKSGRSLSHDISGKKEGERAVSFPFLSPGRQTPQTPAHSPQGGPLGRSLCSSLWAFSTAEPLRVFCVSHTLSTMSIITVTTRKKKQSTC